MDLSTLNRMQERAVLETEGPLLIVAGAGSGKTRVLTYRIAHIIDQRLAWPSEILAFTFTNKAASEMKSRLEQLIGPNALSVWMGTFHSICLRILRKYADRIGYNSDFVIYDTSDQKALMKICLDALEIDRKKYPERMLLSKVSNAKNLGQTPKVYRQMFEGDYNERVFCDVYDEYQKRLVANNAMDFDDLIINCIAILEANEDVREEYQRKFKYIHVDEYQDTNRMQYRLIRLLADGYRNICAVGDGDQSIYAWRGADIRNILDFESDFKDAIVISLEQNYRSTQNILTAANSVIVNNSQRKDKDLWTDKEEGERIRYTALATEKEEAMFVADNIISLRKREKREYKDFAILYRTNAQSRNFEERFRREGIPFKIVGGLKFYDRKEIKDLLAYLRLLVNPKDDISFNRVINEPKRGIGAKSLEKIAVAASLADLSYLEALGTDEVLGQFKGKTRLGLDKFYQIIIEGQKNLEHLTCSEVLDYIIKRTGYRELLQMQGDVEAQSRLMNIDELYNAMKEFEEESEDDSINEFLAQSALRSDQDQVDDDNHVLMMTLHTAKGLEFPAVYMVGMEEGLFPSQRALDNEDEEEERRLCYVGMTRAEEILIMTSANARMVFGRTMPGRTSRFIKEIDVSVIEGLEEVSVPSEIPFGYKKREMPKASKSNTASGSFNPGDKVKHAIFGQGMIITVAKNGSDEMLTVAFDNEGIKKLSLAFANLERV